MPSDAELCREHAKECWAWAAGTKNPSRRILFEKVGRVSATTKAGPISMTGRPVVEQWRTQLSQAKRGTNDGRP